MMIWIVSHQRILMTLMFYERKITHKKYIRNAKNSLMILENLFKNPEYSTKITKKSIIPFK